MIGAGDIARYLHVIDSSRAADLLHAALRSSARGRKPKDEGVYRLYLLGGLLATHLYGVAHVTAMHRALDASLSRQEKLDLGFLVSTDDGQVAPIPLRRLHYVHDRITKFMNFGDWRKSDWLPDGVPEQHWEAEKQARRQRLDDLVNAMLEPTRLSQGGSYAMDATGTWAWGIGRRRPSQQEVQSMLDLDPRAAEATQAALAALEEETTDQHDHPRPGTPGTDAGEVDVGPTAPATERRPRATRVAGYDPEAGYGVKTGKKGKDQVFFGYQVHALCATAGTDAKDRRRAPLGIDFFTVTPAQDDVVEPSLRVIDRVLDRGQAIDRLAVDRHYSYKRFDRWRKPLRERAIKPVHDLRANDHGFSDYNGMKLAAAWPHCPHTPDVLATIPKPGFEATEQEWDDFHSRIEERRSYALQRVNGMTSTSGTTRWRCPARVGTVGCARQEGSIAGARELGLPIVVLPDTPTDQPPRCCTQETVSIPEGDHMKLNQDLYWGSKEWARAWNLRTMIEGLFGNMKNTSVAGMDRGYYRGVGVAHVTLAVLYAAVVTNIHLARTWHNDTALGDPSHPLLGPDDVDYGFVRLTAAGAALLDQAHRGRPSGPLDDAA